MANAFSTNSDTVNSFLDFLDSSLLQGKRDPNLSCPSFGTSLNCPCQWQHFPLTPTISNLTVILQPYSMVCGLLMVWFPACNHTMISQLSCWPGAIRELAASHQPFTPSLYIHVHSLHFESLVSNPPVVQLGLCISHLGANGWLWIQHQSF